MPEIIQRSLVDLALNNLTGGLNKNLAGLKASTNGAWNRLTEARKAARKNLDNLYDAADSDRKKKHDAEIAAYKGESGKPDAPSYDSHQQKLDSINDAYKVKRKEADESFDKDCTEAENEFREKSKDYIAAYIKNVNVTLETFQSAHP
ncbi:unnamed protein product [marine sediment metagenome]|uniref:BAR domain-containing protein n=1 Tax=marine sediment metagenome TaxID=412755 RepID=X1S004_9ZZZZ